ncbi:hypothetical protein [Gemmata massiliana]|uniref:hypothetical protein n=1 Tax=Gemmata massiliana TaxID=1210884 RepID=UPI0013A6CE5E|nr:hypothetical protein [Gemmata massiliana]
MLAKIVHAGAVLPSFELASKTLGLLADISISGRHVGRLTEAIGAELVAARDARTEAHRLRTLKPQVPNVPGVVAVEVDGGRYQRRAEGHETRIGARTRSRAWSRSPARRTTPPPSRNHPRASSTASTSPT